MSSALGRGRSPPVLRCGRADGRGAGAANRNAPTDGRPALYTRTAIDLILDEGDGEVDFLSTGVRYAFDSGTADADPGNRNLRFNNSDLSAVTEIYISNVNAADADVSAFLDTLDDSGETSNRGNLFIESGDGAGFLLAQVTGAVVPDGSPSTYRKVSVTVTASFGAFTEGRVCSFQFAQSGGGISAPVPFADLQSINTSRILGRRTAGSGVIEQMTVSQVLDLIGSAAQGDILYRGVSGWQRLAAPASVGQFLQSQPGSGSPAGIVPGWASVVSGWTLIAETTSPGTVSAVNFNQSVITDYTELMIVLEALSVSGSASHRYQFSTDSGSTFLNIAWNRTRDGNAGEGRSNYVEPTDPTGDDTQGTCHLIMPPGGFKQVHAHGSRSLGQNVGSKLTGTIESTGLINYVRVTLSANNITGGNIRLYERP